jgi:hypothetical protein
MGVVNRIGALFSRRPSLAAAAVLAVLSVAVWGPPVFETGLYYDDWALLAAMDDAGGSPVDVYDACRGQVQGGRPGGCIYHAGVYFLTGQKVRAYHLLSLAYVWATAFLLYLLLTQARFPRGPALAATGLWVIFPGSDATRIWTTAAGGQFDLALYFVAVLLGIAALRREGRRAWALHAVSLLIYLALVFTYEIVVPLIAISGVFYVLAVPGRRAWIRGGVDLAFALVFGLYRAVISPVDPEQGFVVERNGSETASRVGHLAEGAWQSWQDLFMPGAGGALLTGAVALVICAALVARPDTRRPIGRWLLLVLGAAVVVALAVAVYLPANDFYVPNAAGLFNRLNLAPGAAYCFAFVALLGALAVAVRALWSATAATAAVAALFGAVVAWQLNAGALSENAYQESWRVQTHAIAVLKAAVKPLPEHATVASFGHPIAERGYIPVFAASWDLRGMLDYRTRVDPVLASPWLPEMTCQADGVHAAAGLWSPYRAKSELWFVNATTAASRRITSARVCQATVTEWGAPPLFGRTVTGGA